MTLSQKKDRNDQDPPKGLFLISWNVAGLGPTLQRIDSDFGTASKEESSLKTTRSHSFAYFLRKHGDPEILCLQEHKIPLQQLTSRSEPLGVSSTEGYECFWSCCVDPSKRGFNGVVTFAKKGSVLSADSSPFNCKELDDQGRCVMTDHGDFVVFNVYVPYSDGSCESLRNKLRFLDALEGAIRTQKVERSKKIIIAGDLNICSSLDDAHWSFRSLNVDCIVEEVEKQQQATTETNAFQTVPQWKVDIYRKWRDILDALNSIEATPVTTKNTITGDTFEKYRASITFKDGRKKVFIGCHESSAGDALRQFSFSTKLNSNNDSNANFVPLRTLVELMSKIAGVIWDDSTIQNISSYRGPATEFQSPSVSWLRRVMNEMELVDSFRQLYPNANNRFTCWNQYTNRRFENEGTRIDYILLSKELVPYLDTGKEGVLRCCHYPSSNFQSADAALHAATASGLFTGASFGGGGIATATMDALNTQFGPRSTGIIYTPPLYSDHVAVSLLFNDDGAKSIFRTNLTMKSDENVTRKAQPHKVQRSIAHFFLKAPNDK